MENILLYTSGKNTGTLINGVYENGVYTKWNILTINNRTIFNVALKN